MGYLRVRDAAEAAEQLGFNNLAQWMVEAVQAQATDADFFRFAAHIHEINESWPKAIACWEKVKKIDPNDENANRQINGLSAQASIKRSGISDAIDKREEISAGPSEAELEEMKVQKLTPEERYQKEIQEEAPPEPPPTSNWRTSSNCAGNLKRPRRSWPEVSWRTRAIVTWPSLMPRSRSAGSRGRSIAATAGSARGRTMRRPRRSFAEFTTLLNDYQIKEYRRRLSLQSDDMGLQLELGIRLARAGKHDEAIAAFQQARSSAEHKVEGASPERAEFRVEGIVEAGRADVTTMHQGCGFGRLEGPQCLALPPGPRCRGPGQSASNGRRALQ